jgi:choline-glycine betaine transporter
MSEQMEMTLRKALDEVDRIRRRQMWGLAILCVVFLLATGSAIATLHKAGAKVTPELRLTLIANVELMMFTVGFCMVGVWFFITRMTAKILKAIELSSKM